MLPFQGGSGLELHREAALKLAHVHRKGVHLSGDSGGGRRRGDGVVTVARRRIGEGDKGLDGERLVGNLKLESGQSVYVDASVVFDSDVGPCVLHVAKSHCGWSFVQQPEGGQSGTGKHLEACPTLRNPAVVGGDGDGYVAIVGVQTE